MCVEAWLYEIRSHILEHVPSVMNNYLHLQRNYLKYLHFVYIPLPFMVEVSKIVHSVQVVNNLVAFHHYCH